MFLVGIDIASRAYFLLHTCYPFSIHLFSYFFYLPSCPRCSSRQDFCITIFYILHLLIPIHLIYIMYSCLYKILSIYSPILHNHLSCLSRSLYIYILSTFSSFVVFRVFLNPLSFSSFFFTIYLYFSFTLPVLAAAPDILFIPGHLILHTFFIVCLFPYILQHIYLFINIL